MKFKLFDFLLNAITGGLWLENKHLREIQQENFRLSKEHLEVHALNDQLGLQVHYLKKEVQELQHCRAQLMQLRVENSDPKSQGRVGWQVSCWIPNEVLQSSNFNPQKFTSTIALGLVQGALDGIFRVNARGNMTALVFEPLSLDSKKRVLSAWFEGSSSRPGYVAPESEAERLHRVLNEQDLQKLLK